MSDNAEGHFHKGLFYGVVLGLGLAWFFGTNEGKNLKNELFERGENLIEKTKEKIEELPDEDFPNTLK